jgi:predicted amidohydrolase
MRVTGIQLAMSDKPKKTNVEHALRIIDRAPQSDLILLPEVWPHIRLEAWRLFNRCRAHENLAFLISCNCAGANHNTKYAGHSMIVDPLGQVVAEGGEEEQFVTAEINPELVDTVRRDFPALRDRVLSCPFN